MRLALIIGLIGFTGSLHAQYGTPAGTSGSTAIHKDSSVIVGWANRVESFNPGSQDLSNGPLPLSSFGQPENSLGTAEGNSADVVSLGDGGSITVGFVFPLMDGPGPDFAIFENSFSDDFLEFAHVEVSTDGITFVRFPSHSLVPTDLQTPGFGSTSTGLIHNLAGKYRQGYGTPFDLSDLADSSGINLDSINFVRIVDVVGSIDPAFGTMDSQGNLINDPFPTPFESSGFDLDAIGVIHVNGVYQIGLKEEDHQLNVYPNPATEIIHINGDYDVSARLEILDLTGRVLYSGSPESGTIYLSELGLLNGLYLFVMHDNGVVSSCMVQIIR